MISLREFKETFVDFIEVKQRVELIRRIASKIDDYHSQCGGLPIGSLSMQNVLIDKEDGEIYFYHVPFEVTPCMFPDQDSNLIFY
jgi:DNA integrity scanning protein DisA with diadenylate cyclase activity